MTVSRAGSVCASKGFTLVELVSVLMLVGIASSIAIPKFLDMRLEAQIASLKRIEGAIRSTVGIYQPIAALKGVKTGRIPVNGAHLQFHSGYPDGHWNNAWRYMLGTSTSSGYTRASYKCTGYRHCGVGMRSSIPTIAGTTGGRGVIVWPEGYFIRDRCFSYYYNRHDGTEPLIGIVDSGC